MLYCTFFSCRDNVEGFESEEHEGGRELVA